MIYKESKSLIYNKRELDKFINLFFRKKRQINLDKDKVLFLSLLARKKYWDKLSANQNMLERKIIKDIDLLKEKIVNISYVSNRYFHKGQIIPDFAFGLYIDLKPKSMLKALVNLQKEISEVMYESTVNPEVGLRKSKTFQTRFYSCLHTANSNEDLDFFLIDMDEKDLGELNRIVKILKDNIFAIIETRGGYHIYVPKTKETGQMLFKEEVLEGIWYIEIKSKNYMTPIPGTLQGGQKIMLVDY